jgi:hypothetical protein
MIREPESLRAALRVAVEALSWYSHGLPWRDDVGNETDLATKAIAKIKELEK